MQKRTAGPILLGYWNIRGLAQPIRLLLSYCKCEWEDKFYACGDPPEFSRDVWLHEKFALGLDFPNLPYLIDGEQRLTQNAAIMRYLGRKFKLEGKTEQEKIRVDLIESEISDLSREFVGMCYNPNFEEMKALYLERLVGKLRLLSEFLGSREYFAGNEITFPDFVVYEMLDQHKHLSSNCLQKYPNLDSFTQRIEKQKGVAEFLISDKNIKFPLNGPMAFFGK